MSSFFRTPELGEDFRTNSDTGTATGAVAPRPQVRKLFNRGLRGYRGYDMEKDALSSIRAIRGSILHFDYFRLI